MIIMQLHHSFEVFLKVTAFTFVETMWQLNLIRGSKPSLEVVSKIKSILEKKEMHMPV